MKIDHSITHCFLSLQCDAKVEGGVALVAAYIGGLNPDSICTQISDCDGQIVIIPPGGH